MTNTDLPAIGHLSLESKRKLFVMLARELTAGTRGSISLSDGIGELMVYRVPTNAKEIAEDYARSLTEEQWQELRRRTLETENTFTYEEALNLPWDQDSVSIQSPSLQRK